MKHQPKGSMCMSCVNASLDCSHLPFEWMPVIEQYSDRNVVRCTAFERRRSLAALAGKRSEEAP